LTVHDTAYIPRDAGVRGSVTGDVASRQMETIGDTATPDRVWPATQLPLCKRSVCATRDSILDHKQAPGRRPARGPRSSARTASTAPASSTAAPAPASWSRLPRALGELLHARLGARPDRAAPCRPVAV